MECMEKPSYILKANESVFIPKDKNAVIEVIVIGSMIVVGIILIVSLLAQLSVIVTWGMGLLFVLLLGRLVGSPLVGRNSLAAPSPFEIWFYEDYLIIYRERLYCSKTLSRRTYDKLFYKDISKCEYRMISGKIIFYGVTESIWYDYNTDGSLPQTPSHHEKTQSADFNTTEEHDIDFASVIENHSPIKVIMEDR